MARCKNPTPNAFSSLGDIFQAWGPFSKRGPRARAPSFPKGYFSETRAWILVAPTFKKKLSLQASRPFPEGAPRKVSMFKIRFPGRSSDMSILCPETTFFLPKWQDPGCGFFRLLKILEHKLPTCQEHLLTCQEHLPACQEHIFACQKQLLACQKQLRNHFFVAKMARFRLRVFQDSDIPRTQASCMPRTVSCMPRHQLLGFQYALVAVEGCLRRFYFLKTGP